MDRFVTGSRFAPWAIFACGSGLGSAQGGVDEPWVTCRPNASRDGRNRGTGLSPLVQAYCCLLLHPNIPCFPLDLLSPRNSDSALGGTAELTRWGGRIRKFDISRPDPQIMFPPQFRLFSPRLNFGVASVSIGSVIWPVCCAEKTRDRSAALAPGASGEVSAYIRSYAMLRCRT